jgi:hypothetical protein
VDGRDVDFAGIIEDKLRQTTKQCQAVTELENTDPKFKEIKTLVQSYSPPDSTPIKVMHLWTMDNWAVAELEFERLLPAVVAIKNVDTKATIVENAIWSGLTKPWQSGPFIRAYLAKQSREIPRNLLDCFELQTLSFR